MKRFVIFISLNVAAGLLLVLAAPNCAPPTGAGSNAQTEDSPVLETPPPDEATAVMLEAPGGGISHFTVSGKNADFGRYLALGEASLVPGTQEGVRVEGAGVAVVQAENGDQIVADVTCRVDDTGLHFTFHWRDSVIFSTGSTVTTDGAFVDHKPPGLALSSITGRTFNDTIYRCSYSYYQTCTDTTCRYGCNTCCYQGSFPLPCPTCRF